MFSQVFNLKGGARPYLTDDEHNYYLNGIRQLYSITHSGVYPSNYSDIIRNYIDLLYEFTRRTIIDFTDTLTPVVIQKYFIFFNRLRDHQVDYTIVNLNLKSIQCIVLITLLMLEGKNIDEEKEKMLQYFNNFKDLALKTLLKLINNDNWLNIDKVIEIIRNDMYLIKLLNENTNIIYICVILGDLTINDIVETISNNVLLLGVVTDKLWADNFHMYPYHFMYHDAVHSFIITQVNPGPLDIPFIKDFISYINNKYKGDKETLKKLIIILFLILHETISIPPYLDLYMAFYKNKAISLDFIKYGLQTQIHLIKWINPYVFGTFIDEPNNITIEEYKKIPGDYKYLGEDTRSSKKYIDFESHILSDTNISDTIKRKIIYISSYIKSCLEISQKELEFFYHSPSSPLKVIQQQSLEQQILEQQRIEQLKLEQLRLLQQRKDDKFIMKDTTNKFNDKFNDNIIITKPNPNLWN